MKGRIDLFEDLRTSGMETSFKVKVTGKWADWSEKNCKIIEGKVREVKKDNDELFLVTFEWKEEGIERVETFPADCIGSIG